MFCQLVKLLHDPLLFCYYNQLRGGAHDVVVEMNQPILMKIPVLLPIG